MDNFKIVQDIEIMRELLNMTAEELSGEIGVSRVSLNNWLTGKTSVSKSNISAVYSFAFRSGIRLNEIKEQLYREEMSEKGHILLFHGAKTKLEGEIDIKKSKKNNDFGQGFYCGESLEQSAMFVAGYPESSLYMLEFDGTGLKKRVFRVNREWMLTIAYFRERLGEFSNSKIIEELIAENKKADYIIVPIADNRMFEIIDSFIDGEITDIQCQHCLSATNLGNQYVFVTEKAVDQVSVVERCFLAEEEKEYYLTSRKAAADLSRDKVRVARKQYRGQGKYIEEILQ